MSLRNSLVTLNLPCIYRLELETAGYPPDEAATEESIQMRHRVAPELQFACFAADDTLTGFILATRSSDDTLTHDAMTNHDASGGTLCIHSVCVDKNCRRQGIASALLQEYLAHHTPKLQPPVARVLLIAKKQLLPLYEKCGFVVRGPSEVVHGNDPWFECEFKI
eukprot:m.105332 g.105332  ORF g.105332 m.105332 type:complete len:165 (-) comp16865_c1_seq4:443-937(-)